MASEETIGTIIQKLSLDMKEFETSIQKAEGLSKALKMSMKDLGTLSVDPSGKMVKNLDDYSVKTDTAAKSAREFFKEQRLQDRIFRESVQSITAFTFAISLFTQGSDKANDSTKKISQSLLAGVAAANATEFAFFGLGRALSGIPGVIGRLGGALSNLGGPIGIVLGVGAALVSFFQQTNAEAKKTADEGLKEYTEAIERAAGAMDKFLPEVEAAREKAFRASLTRIETQLALFRDIQNQMREGVSGINITPEMAAAAGLTQEQLGVMTAEEVERRIQALMAQQRATAAQLLTIGTTVAGRKRALRPEDLKAGKLPGPPQMYGPEKPAYIDQEYEEELRGYERWQAEHERFWERQDREREQAEAKLEQMREAQWNRDIQSAQNLGNVLLSAFNIAGDSLLGKIIRAFQYAVGLANALRANDNSIGGVLGVVSSVLPFLGLLGAPSGGIGEMADEAMRSNAGTGSPVIRMVGRVDISNGQVFLVQEMPGYQDYMNKKAI